VTAPYEQLAALARRQQELIDGGRLEELAELGARWEEATRSVPAHQATEARPYLEEAARALASDIARLEAELDSVRGELARLGAARRVATSYGGAEGLSHASSLDAQG
jgi:hypothetical protein